MPKDEIIEFAKLLIKNVRDSAIKSSNTQLNTTNLNSPIAKRWRESINNDECEKLAEMVISDSVDQALFYFFNAIDEGALNITFKSSSGKDINLTAEGLGELAGWYFGEWRREFSNESVNED